MKAILGFAAALMLLGGAGMATAGVKCDEKASAKKASCCSVKATKVADKGDKATESTEKSGDHCATKTASTSDVKDGASCSTVAGAKMSAKKASAGSSCCSSKGKNTKMTDASTKAEASAPETTVSAK